ncbi:hypothetical protein NKH77_50535 [Streptomyces sp. M19]
MGNFVEERLRGRFSFRRGLREHASEAAEFERAVAARHAAAVRSRRAAHPDPAEVVRRATAPSVALWERRPGAPDFLKVVAGTADLPWNPPLEIGSAGPAAEVAGIVAGWAVLPQVPVVVGVGAREAVGFEGDRRVALAVARSLLCQAVVGSGPADVTLAVFTDPERLADWDWTKWLPHGADAQSGTVRLVAVGPEQSDTLARNLLAAAPKPTEDGPGPVLLVLVDGAALLEGGPAAARTALRRFRTLRGAGADHAAARPVHLGRHRRGERRRAGA